MRNRTMDADRVKGAVKKKAGQIKEATGKALGDEKLRQEGNAEKTAGTVQNAVGGIKDALRGK
jgi:uncharacterized protein YjbJ (UPF0337 family)